MVNDKLIEIPDEWQVLSQQDLLGPIMILGQVEGTSNLGEIWYAEADAPEGPAAEHEWSERPGLRAFHALILPDQATGVRMAQVP